eukprot:11089638-Karenia_brevis.AAC.1
MPSEAIPACHMSGSSNLSLVNDQVVLKLARRKNKPQGSTLTRGCLCAGRKCCLLCPVHVLGTYVKRVSAGSRIFPTATPARALAVLRMMLQKLGVQDSECYRTHDLRRGHAKDLQVS